MFHTMEELQQKIHENGCILLQFSGEVYSRSGSSSPCSFICPISSERRVFLFSGLTQLKLYPIPPAKTNANMLVYKSTLGLSKKSQRSNITAASIPVPAYIPTLTTALPYEVGINVYRSQRSKNRPIRGPQQNPKHKKPIHATTTERGNAKRSNWLKEENTANTWKYIIAWSVVALS
mmetsp:Transcript_30282/g.39942  ORF Transcript_30282/g.39942 Transcript_30282/m.39942 type:complete len:177 (+) Transcript_30282:50-580(+)